MSDGNTELFIGLVGPIGTDLARVCRELQAELRKYDYEPFELHLSDYLGDLGWTEDLPEEHYDDQVVSRMWMGSTLRKIWERGDALALLAMSRIAEARAAADPDSTPADSEGEEGDGEGDGASEREERVPPPLERTVFILNSLKTPREVETLRAVYGQRFVLVAAYSPKDEREAALEKRIKDDWGNGGNHTPEDLIQRDEHEGEQFGQNVRGTFYRADFFLDARQDVDLRAHIERIVSIIFGHPFVTPSKDEYTLFAAEGAARRSAEPGRQVGAAIATRDGSIVALGTNEVPSPGGGLYWEDDEADAREWKHGEEVEGGRVETNTRRQREIAEAIVKELDSRELLDADKTDTEEVRAAVLSTELGDLTEFGRAMHAEMAALLDAAARGVPVRDATLYTTTFPCHNCARHIVGAGIKRLVYVAPYAKSKAVVLHPDAIDQATANPDERKIHFEPFVGVAPRRYLSYFDAAFREDSEEHLNRKDDDGRIASFDKKQAVPLFPDLEPVGLRPSDPAYRFRELRAGDLLDETMNAHTNDIKEATFDE